MVFIAVLLTVMSVVPPVAAQDQLLHRETQSPDTVMASILVASPGKEIYQASGHTAVRLQSPLHGLDNVFSFETDNAGGLWGQLLGRAKGRYWSMITSEYLESFSKEGRQVTEYPLNLTDPQIRDLWRILDQAVASGGEFAFNIRSDNCNYRAIIKIEDALGRDKIVIPDGGYASMDNGELLRTLFEKERPWASLIFIVGTGSDCDVRDGWRSRAVGVATEGYVSGAQIESPDGATRPLLAAPPTVLTPLTVSLHPARITPTVVCGSLLLTMLLVSMTDVAGRFSKAVRVIDISLLVMQTIGAVILILMAVIPASIGSAWNWMMIPLNPLPLVVWLLTRRHAPGLCRGFFLTYGVACLLFTAAPFLTSEAGLWSSLLSAAIAIRVVTHYLVCPLAAGKRHTDI